MVFIIELNNYQRRSKSLKACVKFPSLEGIQGRVVDCDAFFLDAMMACAKVLSLEGIV